MPATAQKLKIDLSHLPRVTNPTFFPLYMNKSRYLVLKGGGSSGKSVFVSQKLIFRCLTERGTNSLSFAK
jgi:phage terminase large subunit